MELRARGHVAVLAVLVLWAAAAGAQLPLHFDTASPEQYVGVTVVRNVVPTPQVAHPGVGILYITLAPENPMFPENNLLRAYTTLWHSMEGATAAYLYGPGESFENAPMVVPLAPMGVDPTPENCPLQVDFLLSGAVLDDLRNGRLYVEITTATDATLAMRGHIYPRDDVYVAFPRNAETAGDIVAPKANGTTGIALVQIEQTATNQPLGNPDAFVVLNYWMVMRMGSVLRVRGVEETTNFQTFNFGTMLGPPPFLSTFAVYNETTIQQGDIIRGAPLFGPGSSPLVLAIQNDTAAIIPLGPFTRLPLTDPAEPPVFGGGGGGPVEEGGGGHGMSGMTIAALVSGPTFGVVTIILAIVFCASDFYRAHIK